MGIDSLIEIIKHASMITSFVFIMMLLIEYINVQTQGSWQELIKNNKFSQYFIAAFLGATPGCLGAFSVVALFSHNTVSFGALVTAMIVTSGDEAFVMFSLFPLKALWLTAFLIGIGLIVGYLTDFIFTKKKLISTELMHDLDLHEDKDCKCFPRGEIFKQLKDLTFQRALLIAIITVLLFWLITESMKANGLNWIKVTFLISALFALFVVLTVPEHFLEEHLWEHIVKKHLPKIFLWTFGALVVMQLLTQSLDLEAWIKSNYIVVLIIAVLVGVIPESGPHMIFVTLFAEGAIPFSILLASSVVQDGHGTLPLLAVSKRGFLILKIINVITGLMIGVFGTVFVF